MFDLGLLRGQGDTGGLRVEAHQQRALGARAEALAHLSRPDPPRRPVLRDLLEEVEVRVEEERQARREVVHVEAALDGRLDVGEPVRKRERELLRRGRARLPDVVARDRDRVEERHLPRAELDHVHDEPHGRLGRVDPLLLGDVLLEDVRLCSAPEAVARHALLLADAHVVGEEDRRGRVDRHRRGDLAERDRVEERLDVGERVDGDTFAPDLAERARMVRVVAHQRRHVEGRREARLPMVAQVAEPGIRLLGGPEARELPHRPQPAAVHRRIHAPGERILAGVAEIARVVELAVVRGVDRLGLDTRDRREELVGALGRAFVDLLAPGGDRAGGVAIFGRRHGAHCRCARRSPLCSATPVRVSGPIA